MPVTDAARLLGHDGTGALRKRLRTGTLRGLAPYGDGNPTREWMASRPQVEAEAVNRGRITTPSVDGDGLSTADIRLQMLQGGLPGHGGGRRGRPPLRGTPHSDQFRPKTRALIEGGQQVGGVDLPCHQVRRPTASPPRRPNRRRRRATPLAAAASYESVCGRRAPTASTAGVAARLLSESPPVSRRG